MMTKLKYLVRDQSVRSLAVLLFCTWTACEHSSATPSGNDAAGSGADRDAGYSDDLLIAQSDGGSDRIPSPDGLGADVVTKDPWSEPCLAYAKASCQAKLTCSPKSFRSLFGSLEQCEQRLGGKNCAAQMQSPGSTVSPTALAACATATAKQSCADRFLDWPKECSWPGTGMIGARCVYDQQCESERCEPGSGWCGICKAKETLGGSCSSPNHRFCLNGLVCADTQCSGGFSDAGTCSGATSWVCSKPVIEGGTCTSRYQCSWGLACIGGVCVQAKGIGEDCANDSDCLVTDGTACFTVTNGGALRCTVLSYADAGQTCNRAVGPACSGSATCNNNGSGSRDTGVCVAPIADGLAADGSLPCLYPSIPVNGECVPAADAIEGCQ